MFSHQIMADLDNRPHKKRRFFVDDSPSQDPSLTAESSLPDEINDQPDTPSVKRQQSSHAEDQDKENAFDSEAFKAFTGADPPAETLLSLQKTFGKDLERAINAYFDGSWKNVPAPPSSSRTPLASTYRASPATNRKSSVPATPRTNGSPLDSSAPAPTPIALKSTPSKRYIGALGVAGWTTRSGTGLLKPDDVIKIERQKQAVQQKAGRGGKVKQVVRRTQDMIVRFTNARGDEIGRLEKETAVWISALLDQKLCTFEGHCIFAPDRIRTNDTVYLQLRCYLLRSAFEAGNFIKPSENNRETGIFEAKESSDERDLRLRQVALVSKGRLG